MQEKAHGEGTIDPGALQGLSGYVYNILLAAGVIIAVIVATALGIQFMIGGAEGQAKVKEMLVPFIIGCVIVFGGFGLWKVAVTIGNNLEGAGPAPTFDFTGRNCPGCGEEVVPIRDVIDSRYECPKCGAPM